MSPEAIIPPRWRADPFLVEMVDHPAGAVSTEEAIIVEHRSGPGRAFLGAGKPAAIASLLGQLELRPRFVSASMMRGTWELVPAEVRQELNLPISEDWDWMDITHPPGAPGMDRVHELDRIADRAVIDRVRRAAIPDSYLSANTVGSRWFGYADPEGRIRAVGGATGWDGGRWRRSAHLGSIGTEPASQGRGIGAALTAGMAARAFAEGAPRVSLGVWHENARAIEVYRRLGFATTYNVHSRRAG